MKTVRIGINAILASASALVLFAPVTKNAQSFSNKD